MPFVAHAFCDWGPQDAPLEREHSRGKKVAWIEVVGKGGDFAKPLVVQTCASTSYRNEPLLGIEPNPLLRIEPNKISPESLHVLEAVRHARRNVKDIAWL